MLRLRSQKEGVVCHYTASGVFWVAPFIGWLSLPGCENQPSPNDNARLMPFKSGRIGDGRGFFGARLRVWRSDS